MDGGTIIIFAGLAAVVLVTLGAIFHTLKVKVKKGNWDVAIDGVERNNDITLKRHQERATVLLRERQSGNSLEWRGA